MDRTRTRRLTALGGVAFTALLVAWLIPPTVPKTLGPTPTHAAARPAVPSPLPTLPAPPPVVETAPIPPDRTIALPQARSPSIPAAPAVAAAQPEDARIADDDQAYDAADDAEVAFASGYRWARRYEVQDRRECRQLDDDAARDGCRAWLADLRDSRWREREADERGY